MAQDEQQSESLEELLAKFSQEHEQEGELGQHYARLAHKLQQEEESLTRDLTRILHEWLSGTNHFEYVKALNALAVLYELDPTRAIAVCNSEGLDVLLAEAAEELIGSQDLHLKQTLANLINTAATHASARPLLKKLNAEPWLETVASSSTGDMALQTTCAVSLIKLRFVRQQTAVPNGETDTSRKDFPQLMKLLLASLDQVKSLQTTLEGLAILTLLPDLRTSISSHKLKELCNVTSPSDKLQSRLTLIFPLITIFHNLTSYKPVLNQEDQAAQKLRNFSLKADGAPQVEWETDAVIDKRIQELVSFGLMERIGQAVSSTSDTIRHTSGEILLNLTKQAPLRGKLIQQGAAKMTLHIIGRSTGTSLPAIHALARLLITSNPLLVLGPTSTSPLLKDAITHLSTLVQHPSSTSLAQFEALLALTNLTSISEPLRTHLIAPAFMSKLESYLTPSDTSYASTMSRRAAMQTFTNLVMSKSGFMYFAQDTLGLDGPVEGEVGLANVHRTRVHLVLALCDVDDLETRLAASAALSVLVVSPRVVGFLLSEKMMDRALGIWGDLLKDQSEGLKQRGIAIVGGMIEKVDAKGRAKVKGSEIDTALQEMSKSTDLEMAEAAKAMLTQLGSA